MMMTLSNQPTPSDKNASTSQDEAALAKAAPRKMPMLQHNQVVQGQHALEIKPRATKKSNDVRDYLELVERVARAEFRRIPPHMVDLEELISIGALAVQNLVNNKTEEDMARLNISYMATAIRWAIRNEMRVRLKWYTLKHKQHDDNPLAGTANKDANAVREAVYETILSIDSLSTSEDGTTSYDSIADGSATPEEELEVTELGKAVKQSIKALPARDRYIMECRFYKNMQVKDIAEEMGLSSSRITRIVQSSLVTVRQYLKDRLYTD